MENIASIAFDKKFGELVVGIDEVGYGPWAGPVVAGAVLVLGSKAAAIEGLINDSKLLAKKKREQCFELLQSNPDVMYAIGLASVEEINKLNIKHATILAMNRALSALLDKSKGLLDVGTVPRILVDGNIKLSNPKFEIFNIIKGDSKSFSIAASSIVAKVKRDAIMAQLHALHPEYDWLHNVGYGTKKHQKALEEFGVTEHHRKNYTPVRKIIAMASSGA